MKSERENAIGADKAKEEREGPETGQLFREHDSSCRRGYESSVAHQWHRVSPSLIGLLLETDLQSHCFSGESLANWHHAMSNAFGSREHNQLVL